MFKRVLSSVATGLVVTTGLLYLMQFLVASGEEIITEPRDPHFVDWVRAPEPPAPIVEPPPPQRIERPPVTPSTTLPKATNDGGIGVRYAVARPTPRRSEPKSYGFGLHDGPLINIIKVQPSYPVSAMTRGLEGSVVVQFDVSPMGTVENVVVIESSHSVFNKAAIEAAYGFKYRPRIVDGTPQGAKGLRQLFTFEMEN